MKHIYKKVKVNKSWIEQNVIKPGWQKNLYLSNVNKFVNHIRNETFICSLITVAKDGNKLVLLDGQHKLEAIKKTESEFEMDLCVYENLAEEKMMEIYRATNDVKAHRLIDDLKLYLGKHEWLDTFMENGKFPIDVSYGGGVNSIRIDRFLNVLKNGMMNQGFVRSNLSRKNLPIFLENLDAEVYSVMKDFCELYKKCFGEPFKDNWLYVNSVMYTIMKTWMVNKDNFKEEEMIKCFKLIMDSGSVKLDSKGVDQVTLQSLAHKIYAVINKKRSVNKFKEFWLIEEN